MKVRESRAVLLALSKTALMVRSNWTTIGKSTTTFPGFKFSVKVEKGPENHLQVRTKTVFSSCQTSIDNISISIKSQSGPFSLIRSHMIKYFRSESWEAINCEASSLAQAHLHHL